MRPDPGGEKSRFGAERHVWAAQTWRSRASQLREAAGEVPRPLPAPLQVPARPAPESRSDESAGQGKCRRPKQPPGGPSRGSAPSSTSHRWGSQREQRAGPSEVLWEVLCVCVLGGRGGGEGGRPRLLGSLEGAWGIGDRSGDPGSALVSCKAAKPRTGYHLPVLSGVAHMCEIVRFIVHILFLHFGIVWFLVQTVKAKSAEFASSLHQ